MQGGKTKYFRSISNFDLVFNAVLFEQTSNNIRS